MSQFAGKIAVITGGNSGIGLATAKLFVQQGANVIITGRRQDGLEAAVTEIGGNVTAIKNDVSNLADLDHLYDAIKNQFGHIDIFFANAGIAEPVPFVATTEEHFDRHFNINVKGLFFSVQKALPLITDGGSIILNSSVVNIKGMAGFSVYSATKAAVRSFARTWTAELKDRQIRVNVVSPGPIETPIFGKMGLSEQQAQEFGSTVSEQVPLGRFGRPEEIAQAVLFLASNASSYIAGVDLYVDGGMVAV